MKHILTALLVAFMGVQSAHAAPVSAFDQVAKQENFVLERSSDDAATKFRPTRHSRSYLRSTDGTQLTLFLYEHPSEEKAVEANSADLKQDVSLPDFTPSISGLPLGRQDWVFVAWRESGGAKYATRIEAGYGKYLVEIRMQPKPYWGEGGVVVDSLTPEEDARLLEGLARLALGEVVYNDYADKASVRRVSSFASSNSGTSRTNKRAGTAAATVRGKEIIFPIGADQVKVDGEWVEIDGIVGFDGTDAVLPKSVLDKLLD